MFLIFVIFIAGILIGDYYYRHTEEKEMKNWLERMGEEEYVEEDDKGFM